MKRISIGLILFTAVLLTACSGKTTVTQSAESELVEPQVSSSQNETWGPGDRENEQPSADMLEKNVRLVGAQTELIVGICQLENTDLAINAEQATQLIPLWNSLLSLSQGQEVVQDDVEALQEQIKEILTDAQLQAITDMAINQQVLVNFMQEHDLDVAQAAQSFPGGGQPVNGQQPEALGTPPANMTPGAAGLGNPLQNSYDPSMNTPDLDGGKLEGVPERGGFDFASQTVIQLLLDLLNSKIPA